MKKTIMIMMLVLCLPIVFGITAGNEETIFEGECSELIVNITIEPNQDVGEYTLEPDCSEQTFIDNTKTFKCLCTDNETTLVLSPAINSEGDYTVSIDQYIMVDNETTEPINYSITNPTSDNTTATVTLPNNITINRTIQPNEVLNYIDFEDYIIIPEANVTFDSIDIEGNDIELTCTSSGYKCFDIYTEKGAPYSVKINGTSIGFTYDTTTKIVHFCTTFSTKNVALTWTVPATPSVSSGGSSGGGSGGGSFTIRFEIGKPRTLMVKKNILSRFWINGKQHTFKVIGVSNDSVKVEIKSEPQVVQLKLNEMKMVDVDGDKYVDLKLTLKEIRGTISFIEFENIKDVALGGGGTIELVNKTEPTEQEPVEIPIVDIPLVEEEPTKDNPKQAVIIIIIAFVVLIAIIIVAVYYAKKKNNEDG